jgi:SecD/SecF fusion protein
MRNKGFFWFISGALVLACIYMLSFTFVTNSVEKEAELEAEDLVQEYKKKSVASGDSILLPNGTYAHFNQPDGEAIAKSAILNHILKNRADSSSYPVFGSTFKDCKNRSLALGLDLVGGMSVTLEISIPDMVKNFARNPRDIRFKGPFEKAKETYQSKGGDFISLFVSENAKSNKTGLARLFETSEMEGLNSKSSDAEVEAFLRKIAASSMEGVEDIMGRRINQFGVAQPNIQRDKVNNRLYIELPGVQDESTVAQKLQSTANLQFFETYAMSEIASAWDQAKNLTKSAELKKEEVPVIKDTTDTSKKDSTDTVKKADKVKSEGIAKSSNNTQKGLGDYVVPVGDYAVGYVLIPNKEIVNALLKRSDIAEVLPEDLKFMWGAEPESIGEDTEEKAYYLYAIRIPEDGKARVGGKDVKSARQDYDQNGKITVDVTMSAEGADKWSEMTEDNVNRIVAITMDEVVYSAPRVMNKISGGNTQISGSFSMKEAKDLASLLNGGALPAPCIIKEQTKVGPTIGAENSQAGLISFLFAFLAVLIYMYLYYGKSGISANVALVVNVILIFGCLAQFGAVLTLAGIAGIVLTIGTAVDANILIFERIREEQYRGVDQAASIAVGFKKALPSIIDANVTHLLVAIILKIFGTGEINSFATTLIIGIFTSLFSAIIISRLIINSWMENGKEISFFTKISKGLFQNLSFDWVGKRKYFYIFSIAITVLGVVGMVSRGLKTSVEFTGGRTFVVKFDNAADIEYLRGKLEAAFVENGEAASIDLKTKSNDYNVEIVTNYLVNNDGAMEEVKTKLNSALDACKDKLGNHQIVESRSISASISNQLSSQSIIMIVLSLVAIFGYILLRFGQWQYSLGAILGLIHDGFFVVSIFSLLHGILPFSLDVNQAFIAAILTVIGYSMNDTVIVFDRIRENLKNSKEGDDHKAIINKSLNTTLSRTFNTSMILFVVVLIMFIFGGPAIKGFLFALLVGVVIGTYSSLCVATPILIDFSKKLKS